MTALQIGTVDGNAVLVLDDVTSDANFLDGLDVLDAAVVQMTNCSINAVGFAIRTSGSGGVTAKDSEAWGTAPSWDLGGTDERVTSCAGQGLSVEGSNTVITDHVVTGICDNYGMRLAGSNNVILGGKIACSTEVGLWVDDARCSRATGVSIIAGSDDLTANCSLWAVQVTGTNTEPETMLDGIDICGPGVIGVETYGCNSGQFDCAGQPCADCAPGPECDDPGYESPSPCTDPLCWPPEEDRLPQLYSFCYANAGLWDVQVPIKTTRSVVLSLPQLVVGGISDIWRPGGTYDCLVAAELNVWTDDPPSDVGATTVDLYDDSGGLSWTLSVGAGGSVDTEWTYHEVYGFTSLYTTSQLRAEVTAVTTPLTSVQASITLRFP